MNELAKNYTIKRKYSVMNFCTFDRFLLKVGSFSRIFC